MHIIKNFGTTINYLLLQEVIKTNDQILALDEQETNVYVGISGKMFAIDII